MPTYLWIGCEAETQLLPNLEHAIRSMGELRVVTEKQAISQILEQDLELVIIDAGCVENEVLLVSRIRAQKPLTRVLVVTASPTWRRARAVIQAGAMDYLSKSLSDQEYAIVLKKILLKTPPDWP